MILDPHVSEELFGSEVGMGGIVLVEGVDGNSCRRRPCGLGEPGPEGIVGGIADADPIDRTEDDGLTGP
jgi:hypothetical protein